VVLLSQAFTCSIVTGIWCLRYIPVSFDQAIGSTTPAFTALIALLVIGRAERPLTYLTLVPVVVGVALASNGKCNQLNLS
jgi:drug/metabolite transporter (DMT)-like permease